MTCDLPTKKEEIGDVFSGFKIFTKESIRFGVPEKIFFTCFDKDKLVGVLKMSRIRRYMGDVWCISIIDVHTEYRRLGIAKCLYHQVNEFVNSKTKIYWTDLTTDGQQAKINKVGMAIIVNCSTYENIEQFEETCGYAYI